MASVRTQGPRYVSTAVVSAVSDWVVFAAIGAFGAPAVGAQAVSRVAGGGVSFVLNKVWTYESGDAGRSGAEVVRFLQLYVFSYALSLALLHLLVGVLGVPTAPGKLLADGACFAFNFVAMRAWVFGSVGSAGSSDGLAEADGADAPGLQQPR